MTVRPVFWRFINILPFHFLSIPRGSLPMLSIIVVEDDVAFRETMCEFLTLRGYRVKGVETERDLNAALAEEAAQIVILDVMLRRESGFAIAKRLRGGSPTIGIIMFTAKTTTGDHLKGLGAGADCYLTKPLDLRTLEANILSLTRRLPPEPESSEAEAIEPAWLFEPLKWSLSAPNDCSVVLTKSELALLSVLAVQPGIPISHSDISSVVFGPLFSQTEERVASLINRLRRKVEHGTGYPLPVKAARLVGYCFIARIVTAEAADPGNDA
jgi:DNA-binding response OmpR family regulator